MRWEQYDCYYHGGGEGDGAWRYFYFDFCCGSTSVSALDSWQKVVVVDYVVDIVVPAGVGVGIHCGGVDGVVLIAVVVVKVR